MNDLFPHTASAPRVPAAAPQYPQLDRVTSPNVTTDAAAFYIGRRPQTLRGWACHEDGPLRPLRVHGRLAWPVADLKRVLGVA